VAVVTANQYSGVVRAGLAVRQAPQQISAIEHTLAGWNNSISLSQQVPGRVVVGVLLARRDILRLKRAHNPHLKRFAFPALAATS
jgi:hypothetical protein